MRVCNVRIRSPLGRMRVALCGSQVLALTFPGGWADQRALVMRHLGLATLPEQEPPRRLVRVFERYFEGRLDALDHLDLDPVGTEFQLDVWDAVRATPPGTSRTFGELAERMGRPSAVRAVARAVASSPIQLAIPCHRVTTASGVAPGPERIARLRRRLREHEESSLARRSRSS